MRQELKPCPFCGGIPEVNTKDWKYYEDQTEPVIVVQQRVKIRCEKCLLTRDIVGYKLADLTEEEKTLRKIAKDIAREIINHYWNKRA